MAESASKRRQSRGKQVSYRVQDQYNFLDEGDDGQQMSKRTGFQLDDDEDSDTFMPDGDAEEQEEDVSEDEVEEEEEEEEQDEEEDELEDEEALPAGESIIAVDHSDGEIDTGSPPRSQKRGGKKKGIPTAPAAGLFIRRQGGLSVAGIPKRQVRTPKKTPTIKPPELSSRGLADWGRGARGGGVENRVKDLFGPTEEDLIPVIKTRDYWLSQMTLPSREGIGGEGRLRKSFFVSDETTEKEIKKMTEWWSASGSDCFARGQQTKFLSKEEGAKYLENYGVDYLNVLLGVANNPRLYPLKKGTFMDTAAPFESKDDRRGWIFNLGSSIEDAQWACNEEGNTQYLAVAVEQMSPEARQHGRLEIPQAPAFTATTGYPASIQIWAIQSTEDGAMDITKPPELELVICTNWGAPKELRWCPVAVSKSLDRNEGDTIKLGLLAAMFSDGKVRILNISYPKPHGSFKQTQYVLYTRAAFEVQIPDTIPTCIHWASGASLAVATAAGTLGLWTLTRADTFPQNYDAEHQYNPRPWFYRQVAHTFILTVTSGYPSHPTYISITSADGYAKLIDLRSPVADTAITGRGRIFSIAQAWHEHTQSFVMPDEAYLLRSNTIRRYYSNIHQMRADAQIVCCATSPVHPGVLIGGSDGMVLASNPIARVLNYKEIPWHQVWFAHEWRPKIDKSRVQGKRAYMQSRHRNPEYGDRREEGGVEEGEEEGEKDGDEEITPVTTTTPTTTSEPRAHANEEVLEQPLARMTEGYKVEPYQLMPLKPGGHGHAKDYLKPLTIFEEETRVTKVAWNPNMRAGTWAVAGMGDGLLRVEDLAV